MDRDTGTGKPDKTSEENSGGALNRDGLVPTGKRVTLGHLADALGLSTATISLALRDSPLVAEETRAKVRTAATDLGYIYNRSAASLRTARSNLVGVAVHDIRNPYFAEIFDALENEFRLQHRTILISSHKDELERQREFVETLMQQGVDGILICPAVGTVPADIDRIRQAGTPVTLICRDLENCSAPAIRGHDFEGSMALTNHLIAQGHRRIAMIGGRRQSSAGRERTAGFRKALEEAGIAFDESLDFPELMSQAEGRAVTPDLLALADRPTAIYCFNDQIAFGVMSALKRHGLEPGRDMAIGGYDDNDGAASWTPALTTVSNGSLEIGHRAARMLQAQIAGEDVPETRILVPPRLIVRESTPPPA